MFFRCALVYAALILAGRAVQAQSARPEESWLMQNYRFAGPVAPGAVKPEDPLVSQLQEIQGTILAIMRKADFSGDYQAALAAAWQASANVQLMAQLTGRIQPPKLAKPAPGGVKYEPPESHPDSRIASTPAPGGHAAPPMPEN
jgi:hypothetical protein